MLYHFGVENIVVYYIFSILHSTNGELLQRSLLEVKVESRVASSHFTPLVPPRLPPPPSSNKSNVVKSAPTVRPARFLGAGGRCQGGAPSTPHRESKCPKIHFGWWRRHGLTIFKNKKLQTSHLTH